MAIFALQPSTHRYIHYHKNEIGHFLKSEPFYIKPLWMTENKLKYFLSSCLQPLAV